jgi:hypothetical protein
MELSTLPSPKNTGNHENVKLCNCFEEEKPSEACAIQDNRSLFLTGGMFTAKVVARFNLEVR